MKAFFTTVLITFMIQFSYAQNYTSFDVMKNKIISKTIPLISVQDLKKVLDTKKPLLVIDAREKEEFDISHIKGAIYGGYDKFNFSKLKELDKETIIIVYCSVGYRSEKIGERLKKEGFKKVMNLQGGIFDWVNSGYPVYDNTGKETKEIHGYNESWGKWITQGDVVYE